MPTTAEYWDVDGFILNQAAYNIETLAGRLGAPVPRGTNVQVPYRRGQDWRQKVPDSRTITFAMWVIGDTETEWNENYDLVLNAFFKLDSQLSITKRWQKTAGLITSTARGEFAGGLAPEMIGRKLGRFTVDVLLPDPWFYGSSVSTVVAVSSAPNVAANTGGTVVTNDGIAYTDGYGFVVTLEGPLVNPRISITKSGKTTNWVQYTGTIAGGETVTLDIDRFTCVSDLNGNQIGKISHSGSRAWLKLHGGSSRLHKTGSTTTGVATLIFRPPYA